MAERYGYTPEQVSLLTLPQLAAYLTTEENQNHKCRELTAEIERAAQNRKAGA